MNVTVAYGKGRLPLEFSDSDRLSIVEPHFAPAADDPYRLLRAALQRPTAGRSLRDRLSPGGSVGIVVNDITRATPNPLILSAIIDELAITDDSRITLFIATGTHRTDNDDELRSILGADAARRFRIVQNDARAEGDHVAVGTTSRGTEIKLHRELVECDLKILTGFIEPHFFAGFSGGGKAVMPGMAALSTIMQNHSPKNIDHPEARWGVTDGNPIYEEVREAVEMLDGCFLLNVALDREKQITGVFTGDVREAHQEGCAVVRAASMVAVERPFDVVVTSNSGYPLDLNLYQSVKGMSAAAGIVREGGDLIVAAECWDGVPDHGEYGRLLREATSPEELLSMIRAQGFHAQDMWQAQIHARILRTARVHFHSEHLTDRQLQEAFLIPCPSIEATLEELRSREGRSLSICVLPEGPVTIPYFQER